MHAQQIAKPCRRKNHWVVHPNFLKLGLSLAYWDLNSMDSKGDCPTTFVYQRVKVP